MEAETVDPVCGKPVLPTEETPTTECQGETLYFCSRACRDKFACDPDKKLADYAYDLIIVGGGPAGISAGIYAALTDIDTLLVTKSLGGQAWDSTRIVNYPGFESIEGPQLVGRFQKQLFDEPRLSHQICEVTRIEKSGGTFRVHTEDEQVFQSRAVLLSSQQLSLRRLRLENRVNLHLALGGDYKPSTK